MPTPGYGSVSLALGATVNASGLLETRPQSPLHVKALAPGIFHSDGHLAAASVLHFKRLAVVKASAASVFRIDCDARKHAGAARVVHFHRHNPAPGEFHCHRHLIERAFAIERPALRTEIRLKQSARRGLLNSAHFVAAGLQISDLSSIEQPFSVIRLQTQ